MTVISFPGSILLTTGLVPILKFLYYYMIGAGGGHIQSPDLGAILSMMGFLTCLVGLVAGRKVMDANESQKKPVNSAKVCFFLTGAVENQ